jgi:cytochrome c556
MFPVGSEKGAKETWAKPDIWKDNAKFLAGFPKAIDLAKAVAATKDEAAFKTANGRARQERLHKLPRAVPPAEGIAVVHMMPKPSPMFGN